MLQKNAARVAAAAAAVAVTYELLEVIKRLGGAETPEGLVCHTWR